MSNCHRSSRDADGALVVDRTFSCPHSMEDMMRDENPQETPETGDERARADYAVRAAGFDDGMREGLRVTAAALPVPAEGHVMFVLTLPDGALEEAAADQLLTVLHGFADQAAPGRASVVALADGCSLVALSEGQLAGLGLRRVEEEGPVEVRLPSEVEVLRGQSGM